MTRLSRGAPRVYLESPSRKREAEFLTRVHRSQRLHRPWVKAPSTAQQFRELVERSRGERHASFFVCSRETAELAGVINVNEIVRGLFQSGYLGYYAFEPFAGLGYMSEGLTLVIRQAFDVLGLHRLEANVQPKNQRSIRVVSELGFRLEGLSPRYLKIGGRWRDHERWAILAEDWPKRRARR